jgi:hypothetical protein
LWKSSERPVIPIRSHRSPSEPWIGSSRSKPLPVAGLLILKTVHFQVLTLLASVSVNTHVTGIVCWLPHTVTLPGIGRQ